MWYVLCFCTAGVCLNRQDNHRAGRENPKRDRRPSSPARRQALTEPTERSEALGRSVCRLREEGFLKGRRGIETPSPLLRPLGTLGRAKVPRRRQNTRSNRWHADGRFVNRPYNRPTSSIRALHSTLSLLAFTVAETQLHIFSQFTICLHTLHEFSEN